MEPTKSKPARPSYKPMWQAVTRELDAVRTLYETERDTRFAVEAQRDRVTADLLTTLNRWHTAAVVEGLALVAATIIILAR